MGWFGKDEVVGSKVLVCGVGNNFEPLVASDGAVYARFYSATIKTLLVTILDLATAIAKEQYDIVHLFCRVDANGMIEDDDGNRISGTELIAKCSNANVKLLWIASDNSPEGYINNFRARGKRLNLVMTIARKDPQFPSFLDKLLFRMSLGETMPVIWADLAPQIPHNIDPNLPALIFYAGRGGVKLR